MEQLEQTYRNTVISMVLVNYYINILFHSVPLCSTVFCFVPLFQLFQAKNQFSRKKEKNGILAVIEKTKEK